MIGGFNFRDGESGSGQVWYSGDILFDMNGDAQYGRPDLGGDIPNGTTNGNLSVQNTYGYDYALKLDFGLSRWLLYEADGNSMTKTAYFRQNHQSNPWLIDENWTLSTDNDDNFIIGNFTYYSIGATGCMLESFEVCRI